MLDQPFRHSADRVDHLTCDLAVHHLQLDEVGRVFDRPVLAEIGKLPDSIDALRSTVLGTLAAKRNTVERSNTQRFMAFPRCWAQLEQKNFVDAVWHPTYNSFILQAKKISDIAKKRPSLERFFKAALICNAQCCR